MKCGMGLSQLEEKKAVECGYWHLYRYDPRLKQEGKNPFTLDSKEPTGDFQQFLMGQNRYASLKLSFPKKAQELYDKATQDAQERYSGYRRLAVSMIRIKRAWERRSLKWDVPEGDMLSIGNVLCRCLALTIL